MSICGEEPRLTAGAAQAVADFEPRLTAMGPAWLRDSASKA